MAKAKENMKIAYNALEQSKVAFDASPYESLGYGQSNLRAVHDAALRQCGVYSMIGNQPRSALESRRVSLGAHWVD